MIRTLNWIEHLRMLLSMRDATIIVGWGSNLERRALRFRTDELRDILGDRAFCWNLTRGGAPVHPLYQPADVIPKRYVATIPKHLSTERVHV